jgi:hypothetical protein
MTAPPFSAGLRSCPKCGTVRPPDSEAPAWQCPACGIAYAKYAAYRERVAALAHPRPADSDVLGGWRSDASLWGLVGANLLALVLAFLQDWTLGSLMQLYWAQSVLIGGTHVLRMLGLREFSTEGLKMNDAPVPETPAAKRQVALFFLFHYGTFHAVYLGFLIAEQDTPPFDAFFFAAMAGFALHHLSSLRYNLEVDRRGRPNLGTLMFTPYLRIVPMHLTIILGGVLGGGAGALLLFGLLKLGADVGMHLVEHAKYQGGTTVPAAERDVPEEEA